MNRVSPLHARRTAGRILFFVAAPLCVFASAGHALATDQIQPPAPDTIAKQSPAVPPTSTLATAVPAKLAQTNPVKTGDTSTGDTSADVPIPTGANPSETAGPALATTGMISQDVLYSGLALLAVGVGLLLGVSEDQSR